MTILNGSNKSLSADDAELLLNTLLQPSRQSTASAIHVTALDLSNNIIERPINSLPSTLSALDLSRNVLTTASFPSILSVAGLVELNLSHNRIDTAVGLYAAVNLEYLDLSHNRLKSIDGLETIKNMKCLKLANNFLTTFKAIRAISFHRSLRELDISNNPLISPKNGNLKVQVLQIVPSLLVLNNSSIRSRVAVQLHSKDSNIKYSSIFEKSRLMKGGVEISESINSPTLSPLSSPLHFCAQSRENVHKSLGNEVAIEPSTVSPGNSSQLSRFVIDASRDDAVMEVVNVEFYPRNNTANTGAASSLSPSSPKRVLNIVRSKSSDRLNDLIIAGEAAPEDIIRHSIELNTGHSPTLDDSAASQEQSANSNSTRSHSRLPWRNPPNPLPRPKKFEKKTRGMLEQYEKNRTHIRRMSSSSAASTGPWSHTPFDTPPEMIRKSPTSNLSDEYPPYMGPRDRRRSAGDVFREMLSFAGMEIGWDGSGDESIREHMHQQNREENRESETEKEVVEEFDDDLPPPPPPMESIAVSSVKSLKHKLRAKFGMPSAVNVSAAPVASVAPVADENSYSRQNSADEAESEAGAGVGGSVAVSVAVSKSSGHDNHHRGVAMEPAGSPSKLYDDSGLREIEVRRQEILSRLLTVGQGSTSQNIKPSKSPVPHESENVVGPGFSTQMSDSARLYLQKLTLASTVDEKVDDSDAQPQVENPAAARYTDVTSAIEQLKQRKRDSLRMLR